MSLHIGATEGQIASTVLITGDPLRAKYYAETMLTDSFCYNQIRGMFGYTGQYKGKNISIQGTGIGIPSTALYIHELIHSYRVKRIIRFGTCGAIHKEINVGQVILSEGALTDSGSSQLYFQNNDSIPLPHNMLLVEAQHKAEELNISVRCGKIFSTDHFYSDNPGRWNNSIRQGVLAVDMETYILYAMAQKYGFQSLAILTVSDNILTGESAPAEYRETKTTDMMKIALELSAS